MSAAAILKRGQLGPASFGCNRAARTERTARRQVHGAGNIALQDNALAFACRFRIGNRHSGQQGFGIWVGGATPGPPTAAATA